METQQLNQSNSPFASGYFITDGGLETTLIFHEGFDLNYFAAFELLTNSKGRQALRKYFEPYLQDRRRI